MVDNERTLGIGSGEREPRLGSEELEAQIWKGPQVENIVEALSGTEAGESLISPELTAACLKDLGLETSLEDHDRPNTYGTQQITKLFSDIKATIEEVMADPNKKVQDISEQKKIVRKLREDKQKARDSQLFAEEDALRVDLSEQQRKLSSMKQELKLIAEDEGSLSYENDEEKEALLKRLREKREEATRYRRAAKEGVQLAFLYYNYVEAAFSIDDFQKLHINPGYGRLSSTRLLALASLPGLKEAVDASLKAYLRWDLGKEATINGQPVIEGRERNICADPEGISVRNREEFMSGVEMAVARHLRDIGVPNYYFFAARGKEIANALHDIYDVSVVFTHPRNHDMQFVSEDKFVVEDELEKSTAGSMHGLLPVDTEKITSPGEKLRKDALQGYNEHLSLAIRDIERRLITDGLHSLTFSLRNFDLGDESMKNIAKSLNISLEDLNEKIRQGERNDDPFKVDAFRLLAETEEVGLSEIMEENFENHLAIYYLGPFNAVKVWNLLAEMPREQIQLLPEKLSMAKGAIRELTGWLAKIHKGLDKSLTKVMPKEEGLAESQRLLINLISAAWRKMVFIDPREGGDSDNDEIWTVRKKIVAYLRDWIVHDTALLTPNQFEKILEPRLYGSTNVDQATIPASKLKSSQKALSRLQDHQSGRITLGRQEREDLEKEARLARYLQERITKDEVFKTKNNKEVARVKLTRAS
jgi:hypothetical protein